jgi:hypothetical protein
MSPQLLTPPPETNKKYSLWTGKVNTSACNTQKILSIDRTSQHTKILSIDRKSQPLPVHLQRTRYNPYRQKKSTPPPAKHTKNTLYL